MTDRIEVGSLVISGGYFLWRNKERKPFKVTNRDNDELYQFCYTYENSPTNIKDNIIRLIQEAKKKVFIASFRIGEADLIETLYEAARRLRGGVYIIAALNPEDLRRGSEESEDDIGVDIQSQKKNFDELTRNGINMRGHSNCHAKFIVIDDRIALVSSANMETRAFYNTGECGIIVKDGNEVARLSRFFARLWYSDCEWEMTSFSAGKSYSVSKRHTSPSHFLVPVLPDDKTVGAIWTYGGKEKIILNTIQDILGNSRKRILISTFSLFGMKENPGILINPIREAITKRGVEVELLLRARNHMESHRRDTEALAEIGATIYADSLNHAKGIIADEKYGALFSANFDVKHGILNGVELGVRLYGQIALKNAVDYFRHAMDNSDIEFVVNPSQRDLNERLNVKWQSPWSLDTEMELSLSNKEWTSFAKSCRTPPVLFIRQMNGSITIYAGTSEWNLTGPNSKGSYSLAGNKESKTNLHLSAADMLKKWWNTRDENETKKGFCPATFCLSNKS